ncbi:hypothetical protein BpHYR1_020891 [Brachionus plicatilis]|uniref:Uncharacterized protein n=1 Tax=Brachionus plicatilis TaxID=10195 RepID=A0A3M7RWQ9_BRAPC|nr:hypothetical protein BpHYR1_020891 [Brachionus plicatilis]
MDIKVPRLNKRANVCPPKLERLIRSWSRFRKNLTRLLSACKDTNTILLYEIFSGKQFLS